MFLCLEIDYVLYICSHTILVTHESSNIEITKEIIRCLRPGGWLNDEVILSVWFLS
jgi:Ulp1 family protease